MCIPQATHNGMWHLSPAEAQHLRGESLLSGIGIIRAWLVRRRQLRALAELDDRLLDDVGISREAAEREIARSFRRAYARRHMK